MRKDKARKATQSNPITW